MSEAFLGELRIVAFNFPPKGWAFCNGQIMAIQQNAALFSLLGTTYGGNGVQNFQLPNLQGRAPMHVGDQSPQGQQAGEANHTLIVAELAPHTHAIAGTSDAPSQTPVGSWPSSSGHLPYAPTPNTTLHPSAINPGGGGQSHNNLPPYLVVNFCIALVGIFPSRN